jgi:hypothetical protein
MPHFKVQLKEGLNAGKFLEYDGVDEDDWPKIYERETGTKVDLIDPRLFEAKKKECARLTQSLIAMGQFYDIESEHSLKQKAREVKQYQQEAAKAALKQQLQTTALAKYQEAAASGNVGALLEMATSNGKGKGRKKKADLGEALLAPRMLPVGQSLPMSSSSSSSILPSNQSVLAQAIAAAQAGRQ